MMDTKQMAESTVPSNLAEQRRSRGTSLEAVAEATKISMHFLQAIEADEFQKLPGGVYNTNYIRQYAELTGINEIDILARYVAFLESVNSVSQPPEYGISRFQHVLHRLLSFVGNTDRQWPLRRNESSTSSIP